MEYIGAQPDLFSRKLLVLQGEKGGSKRTVLMRELKQFAATRDLFVSEIGKVARPTGTDLAGELFKSLMEKRFSPEIPYAGNPPKDVDDWLKGYFADADGKRATKLRQYNRGRFNKKQHEESVQKCARAIHVVVVRLEIAMHSSCTHFLGVLGALAAINRCKLILVGLLNSESLLNALQSQETVAPLDLVRFPRWTCAVVAKRL